GDLLVGDQASLLLARLAHDPLRLALGLGQHLLALLDDPARLLDLLGDRRPHLVEQVVDLLAIDANLVREWHRARVVHHIVELVYENENVHRQVVSLRVKGIFGEEAVISSAFCKLSPTQRRAEKAYLSPRRSAIAAATGTGTRSLTSPPKVAIS